MGQNVAQKLIGSHLADGEMTAGSEIGLRIDQTLTQDATGTMVMLELEALGLDRVRTQASVQYVDHNLLQADERNMADHLFLRSACQRFGVWYSRPGSGVSHPVHMQRFGRPGASLAGSDDSHTCAAGSLGMLAIGAGGLEVAMAMAGEPLYVTMPQIWGVGLTGALPPWVSAKDVILEMLRRHGVTGGVGRIIEYHGPGLGSLSAMDRHVIANMGAELGATTSVFPADEQVRAFLDREGRGGDFAPVSADPDASYDVMDEIDLDGLEPLIARPSSPGNVVPVREVAGEPVYQAVVGSSANPGSATSRSGSDHRRPPAHPQVSFDVNPTSRQSSRTSPRWATRSASSRSGARIHQAGCNGCIGMGQAPAIGRNSLRTVPRNFPVAPEPVEDRVWLCSPETAAAVGALRSSSPIRATSAWHLPPGGAARGRDGRTRARSSPSRRTERRGGRAGEGTERRGSSRKWLRLETTSSSRSCWCSPTTSRPTRSSGRRSRAAVSQQHRRRSASSASSRWRRSYPDVGRHRRTHAIVAGRQLRAGLESGARRAGPAVPRAARRRWRESFARIHRQNLATSASCPLRFEDPADYNHVEAGDELSVDGLARRATSSPLSSPCATGPRTPISRSGTGSRRDRSPWCSPAARSPWSAGRAGWARDTGGNGG